MEYLSEGKDTYKRIKEWKDEANEAKKKKNVIRAFIFRWISFNGLYSAFYAMEHFSQQKADRAPDKKKIDYFCNRFILTDKNFASKIYSEERKKVFEENIKKRYSQGKILDIGKYLNNLENKERIEEKAKNMILIAYKLRCRLFHGEKDPNLDINKEVIEVADEVIELLLNHIFKKYQRVLS